MPRIYRVMKPETEDKPAVGRSATSLGVRVPKDIQPDADGCVEPGQGGMSVSPSLLKLPSHRIPKRLRHLVKQASGSNETKVWRMGKGDFVLTPLTTELVLRPDSPQHGTVEPIKKVALADYETALAETRDQWIVDETGA